jgi:UDP-N-acetylglucosamine 2-epimerase (non-hydrolysing)
MVSCIDLVVGARPNFMKAAPILRQFRASSASWRVRLIHTGQHYDDEMSGIFMDQLGLPRPDAHLAAGSGSHGAQTARVLAAFEEYLLQSAERSRGVVVVGDVNSTLACALGAAKLGIPVAHVEAGLRSFDRTMPEEINRVVTDAVSDVLLVSEPSGMANLAREGIPAARVHYVGNVMIDSLVHLLPTARGLRVAEQLGLSPQEYGYVTLHRSSNVDTHARLAELTDFLKAVAREIPLVFPVHPRTRLRLEEAGLLRSLVEDAPVRLLEPLGYCENLGLLAASRLVLTDSGGVQKETTYLDVPCLTLRTNTERPVTVSHGTNTVVGADLDGARRLVTAIRGGEYKKARRINGWDGGAAERIVDVLINTWHIGRSHPQNAAEA